MPPTNPPQLCHALYWYRLLTYWTEQNAAAQQWVLSIEVMFWTLKVYIYGLERMEQTISGSLKEGPGEAGESNSQPVSFLSTATNRTLQPCHRSPMDHLVPHTYIHHGHPESWQQYIICGCNSLGSFLSWRGSWHYRISDNVSSAHCGILSWCQNCPIMAKTMHVTILLG